ncbi:glycoside hydrolase [Alkalihalobacillus sp. AL-G]|uniref:glycosyl hydrolase family 18 protein n=1 Tax=Alkalihalobacillus sp. AL-G TaxID=2926399 RepID=UPI00272B011A|nr:glycoside hydrolase [Alkalihalobacillus sp. AL-G]WLD92635.1 glycoside hydrolase [Alkalihalobacillus sp. AL-G]
MKFMSWSMNAPSTYQFDQYMQKINGTWKVIDPDAMQSWSESQQTYVQMFDKYHDKIYAIGMHEFGVTAEGTIYDYRKSESDLVLNLDETAIDRWVPISLQYQMEIYPDVKWSIQAVCFGSAKVNALLDNSPLADGSLPQDNYLRQLKKIAELYLEAGYPIRGIESDFEKVGTRDDDVPDYTKYQLLLERVKNEVCLPLGLELRVNLYAMTGDMNPYYYAWHDYKTMAAAKDMNGEQAIDEFQLMTYDFTYAYSAPGPSTPIWWLQNVLLHVDQSLPNSKTFIGNAGYGRRWGLDNQQPGRAVTYKQLMEWQNGMYIHNDGERLADGTFHWKNQSWLPFTGFNDPASNYQRTYLHLYDRFDPKYADPVVFDGSSTVNQSAYGGDTFFTSYFKKQKPTINGIRRVLSTTDAVMTGNVSSNGSFSIGTDVLNQEKTFTSYQVGKARYYYDTNLAACVREAGSTGEDGEISFSFNLSAGGSYRLIAIAYFPFYTNDTVHAVINGEPLTIGGPNLPDWYPYMVDAYHYYDCGSFDFLQTNTIKIQPGSGYIAGFIICEEFDSNFNGGMIDYNTYLTPFQKRGIVTEEGTVMKTQGLFPAKMTMTGEVIRREPRPALIWEDLFSHYLGKPEAVDLAGRTSYYAEAKQNNFSRGSGTIEHRESDGGYVCIDGYYDTGMSKGTWKVQTDGAGTYVYGDGRSSWSQMILNKSFSTNLQIEADIRISTSDAYPVGGIRLLSQQEGYTDDGYLFLLDYRQNKMTLVYEKSGESPIEVDYSWMTQEIVDLKGKKTTVKAVVLNGKIYGYVNGWKYLEYTMPTDKMRNFGNYGVYVDNGQLRCYRLSLSSVDRYEPMEKLRVEIDGQSYGYGEVERTVGYDEFGYLKYTGLNVSEDTEVNFDPERFDQDYQNLPLATHTSWQGRKNVRVQLMDAGIWFRQLYIGDAEGYSVAWNSDITGFITTSAEINKYGCKGVAMWTMGQEDPKLFVYLPAARNELF